MISSSLEGLDNRGFSYLRGGCAQSDGCVHVRAREDGRAQRLHVDAGAHAGAGVYDYVHVHAALQGWCCCFAAGKCRIIR